MPSSLIRWAFYTPLRLVGACAAVAAVTGGGVLLATVQPVPVAPEPHRPVAQPAPSPSTTAIPRPSPAPSESVDADARREASDAARTFVDTWAVEGRYLARGRWLKAIKPLTTQSLFRGLKATDPTRLPEGRATGVALTQVGAFWSAATVTLTDRLQVDVRMVLEGGTWVVADIAPADP